MGNCIAIYYIYNYTVEHDCVGIIIIYAPNRLLILYNTLGDTQSNAASYNL